MSASLPFHELTDIMARLRAPDGCPWDREQDHKTLKPYLLEEAYEALEAIDDADDDALCGELGDVLLQVVFHAQIAAEERRFDIDDVCQAIVDKLVRRHPHVFGDTNVDSAAHVLTNWEAIKKQERSTDSGPPPSALDGVPHHMPALLRAQRVQEKARRTGFDWPHVSGALAKVTEEFEELRQAWSQPPATTSTGASAPPCEHVVEEYGDLLFALVNVSRFLGVASEDALRLAVDKFASRFRAMEQIMQQRQLAWDDLDLEAMDRMWDEVKQGSGNQIEDP